MMDSTTPPTQVNLSEPCPLDTALTTVPDDLVRLVAGLFEPGDLVLVRLIETWVEGGKKKSRVVRTEHLTPDRLTAPDTWHRLLRAAEQERANIFFGVCPRPRPRANKAHHIQVVRVLWADLDNVTVAEALARVERAGLPRPSVVIDSGHGVHLYWILAEPYVIDDPPPEGPHNKSAKKHPLSPKGQRIQRLIKGIWQAIGGDHTQDLSRLLRLPAAMNRKDERNGTPPVPCSLRECDPGRRYPLPLFEHFAAAEPQAPAEAPELKAEDPAIAYLAGTGQTDCDALPPEVRCQLDRLVRECESPRDDDRSRADFALCCWAVRHSICGQVVWERLKNVGKTAQRGWEYFAETWDNAERDVGHQGTPGASANGPGRRVPCGSLTLFIVHARQTPARLSARVQVLHDGRQLDQLSIGDSNNSRTAAVRALCRQPYISRDQAEAAVAEVLVEAARMAARKEEGLTITEIVRAGVPADYKPDFRVGDGRYWCEALGGEITREKYIGLVLDSLVDAAAAAVDAPRRDGLINRASLIHAVEMELRVVWAGLTDGLPAEAEATLGPQSKAARRWRQHLFLVLTTPQTFEVARSVEGTSGEQVSSRASLITRIQTQARAYLKGEPVPRANPGWQQAHRAFPAWWARRPPSAGKGPPIVIALRWDLGHHCQHAKLPLPGVSDMESLHEVGTRYGVLDSSPPVAAELSGGRRKLAVLAADVTEELLETPQEGAEETQPAAGQS
jgi:hypothetical protein